jgi:hypothetical protein
MGALAASLWLLSSAASLPALDLDVLAASESRHQLSRRLDEARSQVDQARANAEEARRRLDAFLTRHFEEQQRAEPPRLERSSDNARHIGESPDRQRVMLEDELETLRVHRMRLLTYLTVAHPEVAEVDVRMKSIEQRLAELSGTAPGIQDLPAPPDEAERQWNEFVDAQKRRNEQDAAEYEDLFNAWRSAEDALVTALDEREAAERALEAFAALGESEPPAEAEPIEKPLAAEETAVAPPDPLVAQPAAAAPPRDARGSQTLALAALLIALAVAALAAVRLARSAADPVFASVDEIAAALALPVIGMLPAAGRRAVQARAVSSSQRSRVWLQLALAVVVFALVVLVIQYADSLWRLASDPLSGLGRP